MIVITDELMDYENLFYKMLRNGIYRGVHIINNGKVKFYNKFECDDKYKSLSFRIKEYYEGDRQIIDNLKLY